MRVTAPESRGLVEICWVEFDLAKGRKRSSHSRVQQGGISYALQSASSSGDDPLVDLIDTHEQAPNNIGIVSTWLCHSL
jgi:hypothetical protein